MAEGVVDLLEAIEVDEEERQRALRPRRATGVGEEGVKDTKEVTTVGKTGEVVGHRLTVALLAEDAHPSHRQRQANADRYQRGGGKPDGDAPDMVQRADKENPESRSSRQPG